MSGEKVAAVVKSAGGKTGSGGDEEGETPPPLHSPSSWTDDGPTQTHFGVQTLLSVDFPPPTNET